jgi:hypothetical protein
MQKRSLSALVLGIALMMVPVCGFAIDGQVLINQSTVIASGGFPYRITQSGSYKLSGNLALNTSQNANYSGPGGPADVAILIDANNISLDLNGFSITITDTVGKALGHPFYGVLEAGTFSQIAITNGSIRMTTIPGILFLTVINMPSSVGLRFQDLNIGTKQGVNFPDPAPPTPIAISAGPDSLAVHNLATGGTILLGVGSSGIDNVSSYGCRTPSGCIFVNPTGAAQLGLP